MTASRTHQDHHHAGGQTGPITTVLHVGNLHWRPRKPS